MQSSSGTRNDACIAFLEQRRVKNPENLFNCRLLVPLYLNNESHSQAVDAAACCVRLSPSNPSTHSDYGVALLKSKTNITGSIYELKKAVYLDPNSKLANINLSAAYARVGDFKNATCYNQKALEIDPYDAIALRNMSRLSNCGTSKSSSKEALSWGLKSLAVEENLAMRRKCAVWSLATNHAMSTGLQPSMHINPAPSLSSSLPSSKEEEEDTDKV